MTLHPHAHREKRRCRPHMGVSGHVIEGAENNFTRVVIERNVVELQQVYPDHSIRIACKIREFAQVRDEHSFVGCLHRSELHIWNSGGLDVNSLAIINDVVRLTREVEFVCNPAVQNAGRRSRIQDEFQSSKIPYSALNDD